MGLMQTQYFCIENPFQMIARWKHQLYERYRQTTVRGVLFEAKFHDTYCINI